MDQRKFIADILGFFSKERSLREVIEQFGPARNSLDADVISLQPRQAGIESVDVALDQRVQGQRLTSVEFGLAKNIGITLDLLREMYPDDIQDLGGEPGEYIMAFHPASSFIKNLIARGYDPKAVQDISVQF